LREISVGQQDLRFPVQGMFMSLFPGLWYPVFFSQNTNNLDDYRVKCLHLQKSLGMKAELYSERLASSHRNTWNQN
jgi:hypothetical protein